MTSIYIKQLKALTAEKNIILILAQFMYD